MKVGAPDHLRAKAAEKASMAWELHKRHVSLANICATIGPDGEPLYKTRSGAWKAIQRELNRVHDETKASIEERRFTAAQQLETLMEQTMQIQRRRHPLIDRAGRVVMVPVTLPDGEVRMEPADDDMVKLAAINTMAKLQAQLTKLCGWNMPIQIEVSEGEVLEPLEVRAARLNDRIANITPIRELIDASSRDATTETG